MLCLIPIALSACVHYQVLAGGFYVDDYINLYDAIHNGPLEFILRIHGGHSLIVRNGLFYLFYQVFGLDPFPYLLSALAIHLVNVALLQRVLRHFGASLLSAAFFATMWGVSPVAFGVVGWYSAACHAMLTTLVLWVLGDVARASRERAEIGWGIPVRWCLLLIVGASTFGTGIVLPVVFPLVAFLLLPAGHFRNRATIMLAVTAAAVPLLYLLQRQVTEIPAGELRDQGVAMSISVLFGQTFEVARTMVDFLGYGLASVILGPWITATESGNLVSGPFAGRGAPWVIGIGNTLFVVFLIALAAFISRAQNHQRRAVASIVLLCLASYGSIVIARLFWFHEHPAFALQPRYHYLGPALLVVLISFLAGWLPPRLTVVSDRIRLVSMLAFLVVWTAASARSEHNLSELLYVKGADEFAQAESFLSRAIDRAAPGSPVFIENRQPLRHVVFSLLWTTQPRRFPGLAGVFIIRYPENVVSGKRVYFVETDLERLESLRQHPGSRIFDLVISPKEAQLLRSKIGARLSSGDHEVLSEEPPDPWEP